jgi:hypothetical protein
MKRDKLKSRAVRKSKNKRSRLRTRRQRGAGGCWGGICSFNKPQNTGVNEGAHRPPLTVRTATLQAEPNTLTLNPMFNKERRQLRAVTEPVTVTLNPMFNAERATLQAHTVRQPSLLPSVAATPDMKTVELIKSGLVTTNELKGSIKRALEKIKGQFTRLMTAAAAHNAHTFNNSKISIQTNINIIKRAISTINNNKVMINALLIRNPTLNPETYNYEIENTKFNYDDLQNLFIFNDNFGKHTAMMNDLITLREIHNLMVLIQQDTNATAATAAAFPAGASTF